MKEKERILRGGFPLAEGIQEIRDLDQARRPAGRWCAAPEILLVFIRGDSASDPAGSTWLHDQAESGPPDREFHLAPEADEVVGFPPLIIEQVGGESAESGYRDRARRPAGR